MKAAEILEDLRLGRMVVKTEDPGLPAAADRLGRRVFSGLVVATLVGSGTFLIHGEGHQQLGTTMLGIAISVVLLHLYRDFRRKK